MALTGLARHPADMASSGIVTLLTTFQNAVRFSAWLQSWDGAPNTCRLCHARYSRFGLASERVSLCNGRRIRLRNDSSSLSRVRGHGVA